MASVIENGNRKRNLNAEINLVPFIDLLSVSICFLLMTAVWIQYGSLPVKQSHGAAAPVAKPGMELQLDFAGPMALNLATKAGGRVTSYHLKAVSRRDLVEQLDSLVRRLEASNVDMAMIIPNPAVSYGTMIAVMDVLRRNQIFNLGVAASAE